MLLLLCGLKATWWCLHSRAGQLQRLVSRRALRRWWQRSRIQLRDLLRWGVGRRGSLHLHRHSQRRRRKAGAQQRHRATKAPNRCRKRCWRVVPRPRSSQKDE